MMTRRDFLGTVSMSAFAVPAFAQWDFTKSKVQDIEFPKESDPDYWKKIRKLFPMPEDQAFFNTGTLGAQPTVVMESAIEHMRKVASDIAEWDYKDDWITGYKPYRVIRGKLAALINAATDEIALTENATAGMNYISNGLDLAPGDEVLSTDQEHSGGRSGWLVKQKRHKIVYRPLPVPKPARDPQQIVDIFKRAMGERVKVIAIPHIFSGSGTILPIKEICAEAKKKGIFTVIDGAQALGQIAVDVRDLDCDAYFSSMHKWLLAPPGNGMLYIRRERMRDVWTTMASGAWDNHEDEGARLTQRGTGNLALLVGLNAALDFHQEIGPDRVHQRIKFLGDRLRKGLRQIQNVQIFTPLHPEMNAGITSYSIKGLMEGRLVDELWNQKKIRIRGIRQCTHIYNSPREIEETLATVRDLAKSET